MTPKAIGIDLGTTYSCVGVWEGNRVKIIPNDQGNLTTPSYVSFSDTGHLIGDTAKNQAAMNPTNTVFDAKRLISRKFDDPEVQSDIRRFPFRVVNKNGRPVISVRYRGEAKIFTPEEILSMILRKMKEIAESYLGIPVNQAVVTVPAYFNRSQRRATEDAVTIAGLTLLYLVSEPSAAALAYTLENRVQVERNLLIFDLGGGTLDVCIASVLEGVVQVKAHAGDTHLGGEDFDYRLVNHFVQEFRRKHRKDISGNLRALCRLRTACERAKRTLSSATQASIEIESLFEGIDFYTSLTRSRFEELCQDLFHTIKETVEKALRDSKIGKANVHDIVLIGGSTRAPCIIKLVSDFLNGKEPIKSINPDEAVAYGAAVQAAIRSGEHPRKTKELLLLDATSHSTGIETAGGVFSPVIKRNMTIPVKKSEKFSINSENRSSVLIRVFEGERARTQDNDLLGSFELTGLQPSSNGTHEIRITFEIDAHDILEVSATETVTGKSKSITIDNGRFSREEIDRMVREAERCRQEQREATARIIANNALESYAYDLRDTLRDANRLNELFNAWKSNLQNTIDQTIVWLDNPREASKEEYEDKHKKLEGIANAVIPRLRDGAGKYL